MSDGLRIGSEKTQSDEVILLEYLPRNEVLMGSGNRQRIFWKLWRPDFRENSFAYMTL